MDNRRWPKAAKHFRLGSSFAPSRYSFPLLHTTPALHHFCIAHDAVRSAIRCSTTSLASFVRGPSKKPLMSNRAPRSLFSSAVLQCTRASRLFMLAVLPWSEPVRKIQEISLFVDGVAAGPVDRRTTGRSCLPVAGLRADLCRPSAFGINHSTHRLRSVRSLVLPTFCLQDAWRFSLQRPP